MKRGLAALGLAFIIALTIVLGFRVSADALAVIAGVFLGILASIPTTVAVVYVLMRQQTKLDRSPYPLPQHPPVVVINAADKNQGYSPPALPSGNYPANGTRRWTVIGEAETDLTDSESSTTL